VLSGEPTPGGGEGPNAELIAVEWLWLNPTAWPVDIVADRWLYPQLLALYAVLSR
jgi:hypothetical protein